MASTIPNIAKGRINEFARNVNGNSPANSAFVVVLLQDTGLEAIDTLRDYDTLAALLANNDEVTVVSYTRLVLDDSDIADPTVDDTGNEQTFDVGDFDFGALEAGQNVQASVVGYDPDTTSGDDTNIIPVHITRLDSPIALNGETFHWRTPNGLWAAEEPA